MMINILLTSSLSILYTVRLTHISALWQKRIHITICGHVEVFHQRSALHNDWLSPERWIYSSSCPQRPPATHTDAYTLYNSRNIQRTVHWGYHITTSQSHGVAHHKSKLIPTCVVSQKLCLTNGQASNKHHTAVVAVTEFNAAPDTINVISEAESLLDSAHSWTGSFEIIHNLVTKHSSCHQH